MEHGLVLAEHGHGCNADMASFFVPVAMM